jgi:hypothetical protein
LGLSPVWGGARPPRPPRGTRLACQVVAVEETNS